MSPRAVEEVEFLGARALRYAFGPWDPSCPLTAEGASVVCTGSGRAALRIVLEKLTAEGVLPDRNAPALVPRWMCQSVLHTMHRFCSPVTTPVKGCPLVLAYHQYGFPQDMQVVSARCADMRAVLVEDCAHAVESTYGGRRLGTFGRAAIFSLSKFFPSVLGGALMTADEDLSRYARGRLADSRWSLTTYAGRSLWEILRRGPLVLPATDLAEMLYAVTDSAFRMRPVSFRVLRRLGVKASLERRRENYRAILERLADRPEYFAGLERDGVTPYVVPLFDSEDRLERIAVKMRDAGFMTGVYHFDVARNLFEPRFEKCVWLPVHQGLALDQIERACEIVRAT